jgi:hypothetical protein
MQQVRADRAALANLNPSFCDSPLRSLRCGCPMTVHERSTCPCGVLDDILDLDADQVIFVPLCARCSEQIEALGQPTKPSDAGDVVIVR